MVVVGIAYDHRIVDCAHDCFKTVVHESRRKNKKVVNIKENKNERDFAP